MVSKMARSAFEQANRLSNGRLRKKHKPYTLPPLAPMLCECLGDHDQKRGEERAKALMLTYEGQQARWGKGD
jgi:hypothetical protein